MAGVSAVSDRKNSLHSFNLIPKKNKEKALNTYRDQSLIRADIFAYNLVIYIFQVNHLNSIGKKFFGADYVIKASAEFESLYHVRGDPGGVGL